MQHAETHHDRGFTQLAALIAVLLSMASLLAVALNLNDTNGQQVLTTGTAGHMTGGRHMYGAGRMPGGGTHMYGASRMPGGGTHMYGAASSGGAYGSAGTSGPSQQVRLVVKSDEENGKMGTDGNWHDAFLPADFSVQAGATVTVTVLNYDDMPHTFTAPGLGVNAEVPGGSEDKPAKVTFTFHAPDKAGNYEWYCAAPCDPWAMSTPGFMKGKVTVL